MIVWLWDARGCGRRGSGISDDRRRARRAAAALLRSGCDGAVVEEAVAELGMATLTSGYRRTGQGWQAQPGPRGRVRWQPLPSGAGLIPLSELIPPSRRA